MNSATMLPITSRLPTRIQGVEQTGPCCISTMSRLNGWPHKGDVVKIPRAPLALLVLTSSSIAFAQGADARPVHTPSRGAEALCAMANDTGINKAQAAMPIDSWYLQTSDDLNARPESSLTCHGTPSCMGDAKEETKGPTPMPVDSWYLQTTDDLIAIAHRPVSCNETQNQTNRVKKAIKSDVATGGSWYLQTEDDIRAVANQPVKCNTTQNCLTRVDSRPMGIE